MTRTRTGRWTGPRLSTMVTYRITTLATSGLPLPGRTDLDRPAVGAVGQDAALDDAAPGPAVEVDQVVLVGVVGRVGVVHVQAAQREVLGLAVDQQRRERLRPPHLGVGEPPAHPVGQLDHVLVGVVAVVPGDVQAADVPPGRGPRATAARPGPAAHRLPPPPGSGPRDVPPARGGRRSPRTGRPRRRAGHRGAAAPARARGSATGPPRCPRRRRRPPGRLRTPGRRPARVPAC